MSEHSIGDAMPLSVAETFGLMRADGTLELPHKLSVPPGRVKVRVESLEPYAQSSRRECDAVGHHFMNEAEVTAFVEQMRGDEKAAALFVRIAWMRRQGLDMDEIEESLQDEPPWSVAEELKQIKALDHLDKISVPSAVLGKFAINYD